MPIRQAGRRAIACLALVFAAGAAHAATKVTITSPAGEPIGGGVGTRTYAAPKAAIDVDAGAFLVRVRVSQGTEFYDIRLQAPAGRQLLPGGYANAEYIGAVTGLSPGLAIHSHNGGCSRVWGSFVIRQAMPINNPGGFDKLEATFNLRCNSDTAPALTGTIYFDAGPRYFTYSRDAGFPMGTAASKSYYGHNSETSVFGAASELDISVRGQRDEWLFRFQPPIGRTFAKGIYTLANESTPEHAGLEMHEPHGDFCEGLAGSVNIRNVTYDTDGWVTGLYATWTVTCNGQPAAYRGTFHHDL